MTETLPIVTNPGRYVLGADNGYSGSLVFVNIDTGKIAHVEQYPRWNAKRLYGLIEAFRPAYACTEEVFMSRGFKGVASNDFQVMGRYSQCFEMLDIPYHFVRAVSWRPVVGVKAKGRDNLKEAAIARCREIFDDAEWEMLQWTHRVIRDHKRVEVTEPDNNKCESALIAIYALKHYLNLKQKENADA